jgi:DNA polymerase
MAVAGPGDCPDLGALREHIGDCRRCPLSLSRTTLVFGSGDPCARLMFIGEAPGKNEDMTGEPFVGAAGKLLDELLSSIGIERGQVYIANMVKCRPPGNRDPEPIEMETCSPFLSRQIELIDPVVIATLGRFSAHYVLQTDAPISALHGRLYRVGGRRVVQIFHPAAALYDGSKRSVLQEDFRKLRAVIDRVESGEDHGGPDASVASGPLAAIAAGGTGPVGPETGPAGTGEGGAHAPVPDQPPLF